MSALRKLGAFYYSDLSHNQVLTPQSIIDIYQQKQTMKNLTSESITNLKSIRYQLIKEIATLKFPPVYLNDKFNEQFYFSYYSSPCPRKKLEIISSIEKAEQIIRDHHAGLTPNYDSY